MIDGDHNIDLQNQSFDTEIFDIVITQDVFEHIPYPEQASQEIYRTTQAWWIFHSNSSNQWQYKNM